MVSFRELIESMKMFQGDLDLKVVGAPQLSVRHQEVGLKAPENIGVETRRERNATSHWRLAT
jgi:hypothetical protein